MDAARFLYFLSVNSSNNPLLLMNVNRAFRSAKQVCALTISFLDSLLFGYGVFRFLRKLKRETKNF